MKYLLLVTAALVVFCSCQNSSGTSGQTFCDTACRTDSFIFNGEGPIEASVKISMNNCQPDTLIWTHYLQDISRQLSFSELVNQEVRLNPSAISCFIKDTSYAWLSFNDCITGRGYLFKLPFNKAQNITKISGALNAFDPKFSIAPDLRAYTDRGSIFVVDVNTGKEAMMTFGESYDIDFNQVHETVDSVNVTHQNIYVRLLKDNKPVEHKKAIDL